MSTDIREQIHNLAQDLLNLEVLTIVKPNITGRKMPEPKKALAEICSKYSIKLLEVGEKVEVDEAIEWGSYPVFEYIYRTTNQVIGRMKDSIQKARAEGRELPAAQMSQFWMLYRIKTMCEALMKIFIPQAGGAMAPLFTADNLVLIRKAWELGIEEIAMKTVVQLDGDVITRVQTDYATEKHATIHKLHNIGVSTSLAFWKTLVEIIEKLLTSLVKLILPQK